MIYQQLDIYRNKLNKLESFVLKKGNFPKDKATPVRVLSKKTNRSNLLKNKSEVFFAEINIDQLKKELSSIDNSLAILFVITEL